MSGGISDSPSRRAWEIITRRARMILSDDEEDEDGYGYHSLIEFTDGTHYPFPALSPRLQGWARRLKIRGTRGVDWVFHCPVCNAGSYYTLKRSFCQVCGTQFDNELNVVRQDEVRVALALAKNEIHRSPDPDEIVISSPSVHLSPASIVEVDNAEAERLREIYRSLQQVYLEFCGDDGSCPVCEAFEREGGINAHGMKECGACPAWARCQAYSPLRLDIYHALLLAKTRLIMLYADLEHDHQRFCDEHHIEHEIPSLFDEEGEEEKQEVSEQ